MESIDSFYVQRLLTNFTEWNCDLRIGSGINLILFEPKTLVWRFPAVFTVSILVKELLILEFIQRSIANIHAMVYYFEHSTQQIATLISYFAHVVRPIHRHEKVLHQTNKTLLGLLFPPMLWLI